MTRLRNLTAYLIPAMLALGTASPVQAYVGLCCAKCGGNMPLNIPGAGVPETHEFRLKLSPTFMHMDELRDGTDSVSPANLLGNPAAGGFMAVPTEMDMTMLNLAVGYSFTDRWFGGLMMMYEDNAMDMRFNQGMQTMTGRDGYTMRSQGISDTMLMAKYLLYADDPLIPTEQTSVFLGLSLPTGSIEERNDEHPLALRRDDLLPYGMQLGSGTVDPSLGFTYSASSSPWWWGANVIGTARLYENSQDYRWGNELRYDAYVMHQVRYDTVLEFQLNGRLQGDIRGEAAEVASGRSGHATEGDPASTFMTPLYDPDNYGGHQVFATAGVQWQPWPLHILNLQLSLPIYRDLNGPQLETDYRIMATWYVEIPTAASVRYRGGHSDRPSKLGF